MTHARQPLTFPRAITKISLLLGYAQMATIVERSQRLVRKWSHPTSGAHPTVAQAVALDAAYMAAGGGEAPIAEVYLKLLNASFSEQLACRLALARDIAVAAKECGEAISFGLAVAQPGSGPREVYLAADECEQAQDAMAVVLRRLTSFLPGGAGSPEESPGGHLR